jgi:NADH:ubiquinone oxidoreductase subunit B-like Fe-S oxidoreductase
MAPLLRTLYEQMPEPKYVIATGACTISGGPFIYHSYTTIRGADTIIPVDVYIPGCPPRPESLLYGLLTLQKMIKQGETIKKPGIRHRPVTSEIPPGVTLENIKAEMIELLEQDANVDVHQVAMTNSIRT